MTRKVRHTAERAPTPLRIFVVENHADTREILIFLLEGLGHTVIATDTMGKALREAPAANCDVLISDIGLSDGDGWELLSRLHLQPPMYAIAMSGRGMMDDRARSKAAGFRHHLVKPMGLEQLEGILSEAAHESSANLKRSSANLKTVKAKARAIKPLGAKSDQGNVASVVSGSSRKPG